MNNIGQESNRGEGRSTAAGWGPAGAVGAEQTLGTGRPGGTQGRGRGGATQWLQHGRASPRRRLPQARSPTRLVVREVEGRSSEGPERRHGGAEGRMRTACGWRPGLGNGGDGESAWRRRRFWEGKAAAAGFGDREGREPGNW